MYKNTIFKALRAMLAVVITLMAAMAGGQPWAYAEDNPVQPAACNVQGLEEIVRGGVYPQWAPANGLIAFNLIVADIFEIFTLDPDSMAMVCLTCNKPGAPDGHKGQPFWHISGDYIVFTAENEHAHSSEFNLNRIPGMGRNHDVWIMTSDGDQYWRITEHSDNWGVIRTRFSPDGTRLYWNEEYSMEVYPDVGSYWDLELNRKGEEWGLWRIQIADVAFGADGPAVSNVQTVHVNGMRSCWRLGEGAGFTPGGQALNVAIFNICEQLGSMVAEDLYVIHLQDSSVTRLTSTWFQGDENPEHSPDGQRIAWTHHDSVLAGYQVELHLMDADGGNQVRLTFLNEPDHPHFVGQTWGSGELTWSPDGRQIVASFIDGKRPTWPYHTFGLYEITFEGPCGNLGDS